MRLIWNGIYKEFGDIPAKGEGFSGSRWRQACLQRFQALSKDLSLSASVPSHPAYSESLLPFLAALLYANKGKVRILDFGGGLGESYLLTKFTLSDSSNLLFHIVEVEEICKIGRTLHNDEGLDFMGSIPEPPISYDIIHLGSSIQYVEDWQSVLEQITQLSPRFILFTDLISGDIPTIATAQKYYNSDIPMWFFNRNEFIKAFVDFGYKPAFTSRFQGTFWNKQQEIPMDNFPEKHKLRWSCNMLFVPSKEE